jgi:hypothetical protein
VTLENPYFEEVAGGVTVGANRASWSEKPVEILERRDELVEEYSWGIPTHEAIKTIVEYGPIVEVGAGTGYWAWCIDQLGGVVAATDADPPESTYRRVATYDARRRVNAMVADELDAALLLVWPPYDDPMAADALEAYPGETVIYVGEGRGGCTADHRFHHLLHEDWELTETVDIPTYLGLHDRLEVWRDSGVVPGGDRQ